MVRRKLAALFLVLCLAAPQAPARTVLKPAGFNLFSKPQEVELGKQAAAQAEKQVQVLNDPALTNYVSTLGRKLSRFAPDSDYPFSFKVVRDKNINAFALPGGPIYVNTGTIEAAENEAQLAGVMAHEIGHVVLRHATHNASRAYAAQVPLAILGGMLGSGGLGAQLAGMVASFGVNSLFLKYSRDAEKQADLMGTQILYDSGYDAGQMARFFEKLEKQEKGRPIEFLSDHPNPGNRVTLVSNEVRTLGAPRGSAVESAQFIQMRSQAADWDRRAGSEPKPASYGHDAGAGHSHPDPPSGNLRVHNGRGFRISYPDNWQVSSQESTVTIAPSQGVSSQGIAYGALISVFDPEEGSQGQVTLSQATSQLIEQLRQSNPGTKVSSGSRQRMKLSGGAAAESATLIGKSPVGGENEIDWLVAVMRPDGTLWYVVFIAPERDFSAMRSTFARMLDSVQLVN